MLADFQPSPAFQNSGASITGRERGAAIHHVSMPYHIPVCRESLVLDDLRH